MLRFVLEDVQMPDEIKGRTRQPRDVPPAHVVILDEGVSPRGGRGGPGDGEHRGGAGLLADMEHPTCCNLKPLYGWKSFVI